MDGVDRMDLLTYIDTMIYEVQHKKDPPEDSDGGSGGTYVRGTVDDLPL